VRCAGFGVDRLGLLVRAVELVELGSSLGQRSERLAWFDLLGHLLPLEFRNPSARLTSSDLTQLPEDHCVALGELLRLDLLVLVSNASS